VSDDALALAFRSGLPFVGLRDHEPDPEVDRIVPREAAAAAGVVALTASDDHVRFAVPHPGVNLSSLAPYLGNRRVELAIAPRAELEAIVGAAPRAPAEPPPAGQETLLPVEGPPAPVEPAEPSAATRVGAAQPGTEGEPPAVAEPVPAVEPLSAAPAGGAAQPGTEGEPPAVAEPATVAEPTAPAEPAAEPAGEEAPPTADELAAAAAAPGAEELLGATPAAEEAVEPAAAEPGPAPVQAAAAQAQPEPEAPPVERFKAHPEPAEPGEEPSWLAPPSRLQRVLRVLVIILMLLVVAGGALLAYLLTR
jgi:hypothetical protein